MAANERLCRDLQHWAHRIKAVSQHPVKFRATTWQPHLAEAGSAGILDELGGVQGTIDRKQLRALARRATTSDDRRRLFVATMIWGSGTTNGRGPRYTKMALQSGTVDDVLAETAALAGAGRLAAAYRAFRLPGVGPSFFTKWFWAVTSNRRGRRALILDNRVWNSLGTLGWNSIDAAGTRRRGERYEAYVDAMHECARRLSTDAESIEIFLFQANGNLK